MQELRKQNLTIQRETNINEGRNKAGNEHVT